MYIFSLPHQQEWIGFDAAPKYSTLSFQYPFSKYGNFTKAGIGAYLDYDKIGPFTKTGAALTYTYRIRPQLFGNNDDYLSFGIGGQMSRYTFRSDDLVGLDGISTDPQLIEQAQTSLKPNFNFGVFYMNAPSYYSLQSHYYVGLSINQAIPSRIFTTPALTSSLHATMHFGYRYFETKRSSNYIEPNIMVIYAFSKAIHAMANLRYEELNKFWLAGGIGTNGEIFIQPGVILDSDSFIGPLVKDGALRVGLKADYIIGKFGNYAGLGYEGYISYIFEK